MLKNWTRRGFVRTVTGSTVMAWLGTRHAPAVLAAAPKKPAVLGGTPVHKGGWPPWPQWRQGWEKRIVDVLRSGRWSCSGGGGEIAEFEAAYARLLGAKRCVATSCGTTALLTSLHVVGVDAGDEVIVSPYTFIATYNVILAHKALPVFADTDPTTLTMDPASIASRITDRTRAIVPVHIYGMPCDMDSINAIAKQHELAVVEDACQAWLAEYRGKKCGTLGDLGCFSFQNSKHITSGEGGAITSNSDELIDRCQSYHNCGRQFGTFKGSGSFSRGSNFRLTHMQGAMLNQQCDQLVQDTKTRQANADYLTSVLKDIPGIDTVRLPGNSRAVWHLYAFRYDKSQFNGLSRNGFIKAMRAEGVPCSGGYHEQYYDGLLDEAAASRGFQRLFSKQRLAEYRDSLKQLTGNKRVCETTVGMYQTILLADRKEMDNIAAAVRRIQKYSGEIAKKV